MQETTLRQDNTNRIRTLQAARFLFILLIYLNHSVEPLAHSPFDFGGEGGVAFFFVLSGFVLSYGYGPRVSRGEFKGKRFFWKHFWHLYPLHLLFFSATVALDYRLGVSYDALQIATSLLLVQTWIPSDHTLFVANGVSWFLCDTLFCYIVFAWLYKWLTSIRTSRLAIGMTVLAAVYACLALQVPDKMTNCTLYSNPLLRAIDFSLGIIAYRFYKTFPSVRKQPRLFPYVDVALLLAVYALYQIMCPQIRCSMLFWPVMPLIVVRLTTADASEGWATRLLQSKPMSWLGSVSFEIFIAHLLVIRIVQHIVGYDGSEKLAAINLAVSIVSTILVAEALRRWFVKPVTDVINRRLLR